MADATRAPGLAVNCHSYVNASGWARSARERPRSTSAFGKQRTLGPLPITEDDPDRTSRCFSLGGNIKNYDEAVCRKLVLLRVMESNGAVDAK